jgi:hypothetical protein
MPNLVEIGIIAWKMYKEETFFFCVDVIDAGGLSA